MLVPLFIGLPSWLLSILLLIDRWKLKQRQDPVVVVNVTIHHYAADERPWPPRRDIGDTDRSPRRASGKQRVYRHLDPLLRQRNRSR